MITMTLLVLLDAALLKAGEVINEHTSFSFPFECLGVALRASDVGDGVLMINGVQYAADDIHVWTEKSVYSLVVVNRMAFFVHAPLHTAEVQQAQSDLRRSDDGLTLMHLLERTMSKTGDQVRNIRFTNIPSEHMQESPTEAVELVMQAARQCINRAMVPYSIWTESHSYTLTHVQGVAAFIAAKRPKSLVAWN